MLLTGDSSFSHKGRRACLAIFNFQSIPAASMPEPTLQEPLKSEDDLQQSRSTLSSTREESLHQASLMAGTRVLGPSDAPCLVKSSTAHGDLLLWIMFSSIGVINLSGLSSYDSTVTSEIRLPYILRSKIFRTFAILVVRCLCRIPLKSNSTSPCSLMVWSSALTSEAVMTLTAEGSTLIQPSFPAIVSCPYIHGGTSQASTKRETLGFTMLGLPHYCGPLTLCWPNDTKFSPSPNLSRPRCVYYVYCPSPFTCFVYLHDPSSRRLCLYPEATNRLWLCTCSSQTLLLTFPQAKTFQTLIWKISDVVNAPTLNDTKPRSVFPCFLFSCSRRLGRFHFIDGRRHHLRMKSPSLLWLFNHTLRTLELVLNLAKSSDSKSLKVFSLLFPNLLSWKNDCGYRISMSKYSSTATFAKDSKYRLYTNTNKPQPICSSPNGVLEQSSSDFEIVVNGSPTFALLWLQSLLPLRITSPAPSSTSLCLLTVTILPSIDSFVEARSTNRDLTCIQKLSSLGLKALMEPLLICFNYLLVFLGNAPLCNALNFGIFAPLFSMYLNLLM